MGDVRVRDGGEADLPAIDAIYAHYVLHTAITFDLEPPGPEGRRAWLAHFDPAAGRRLLVAEEDGRVLGYAGTLVFRAKPAYRTSVESTVYLHPDVRGRGVGSLLYEALLPAVAESGIHRVLAGVTLPNPASEALHRRFDFRPVGTFHEVGHKLGRFWDVRWFEKRLA